MNAVETLRAQTTRFMTLYIAAHVPLMIALEWLLHGSPGWLSAVTAAIAASTWLMSLRGNDGAQRMFFAVAMMLTVSCVLGTMAGHPWQADIHMYFFACLAMLVAFCD